jgi:hypothetical protein
VELRGKYQTAVQDLDNVTRKVEELTRALEENKAKKKMVRKKKEEHSEQDITRIKNEMKTAGLVPGKED